MGSRVLWRAKKSPLCRDLGARGGSTLAPPDTHLQSCPLEDQGSSGARGALEIVLSSVKTVEMGDRQHYSVKQSVLLFLFVCLAVSDIQKNSQDNTNTKLLYIPFPGPLSFSYY